MINKVEQKKTPYLKAYEKYQKEHTAAFDVPGHHQGNIRTDFDKIFTHIVYKNDVNCPRGMDNIMHPTGAIKEAQELFAKACGADYCKFLINGSTSGNLIMFLSALQANDKVILPRNVHKSVINALILSGAVPVFVIPDYDLENGIANGVPFENYKLAIDSNPDAKAVFVINPTYFGVCSDLRKIVEYAHSKDMIVICDEAHGSHFYFNKELPVSAMDANADISSLSMHKTAGSLTQSSLILIKGDRVDISKVKKAFSMFSSTSPNHLLLASIDVARKKLYFEGEELLNDTLALAKYARTKLNQIKGIKVFDKHYCHKDGRFDFDLTKLVIKVTNLGLSGFEVYRMVREEFNIQLELAEVGLVLCILTIGSTKDDVDRLIEAFKVLSDRYYAIRKTKIIPKFKFRYPKRVCTPFQAFNAPKKLIDLEESVGEICGESLMIYPPGIPLAIPGEVITLQAVHLIEYYLKQGGVLLSDSPEGYVKVIDKNKWYLGSEVNYDY